MTSLLHSQPHYHGSPTQADHNSRRSILKYSCLVVLAVEKSRKFLLLVT